MKTCLSVEYNVSLWDIYLFVFFKAVFKFFGRLDIKNLLTSWPTKPCPSHTPINNTFDSSFKFLYMKKLSWLYFKIPGPLYPTWDNDSILYIFLLTLLGLLHALGWTGFILLYALIFELSFFGVQIFSFILIGGVIILFVFSLFSELFSFLFSKLFLFFFLSVFLLILFFLLVLLFLSKILKDSLLLKIFSLFFLFFTSCNLSLLCERERLFIVRFLFLVLSISLLSIFLFSFSLSLICFISGVVLFFLILFLILFCFVFWFLLQGRLLFIFILKLVYLFELGLFWVLFLEPKESFILSLQGVLEYLLWKLSNKSGLLISNSFIIFARLFSWLLWNLPLLWNNNNFDSLLLW